ncbi:hypothetical protein MKX01_036076 [Papaver californicum]|nr:hypothetical protein MKX01_036076 [Papaver californicum]
MDYERIDKNQVSTGGGFSPAKLRSMVLGLEKKRKEEEQVDSKLSLRSELNEIDDRGVNISDNFKDVDIVSEIPGCFTDMTTERRLKEQNILNSRVRSQEDGSLEYDSANMSSIFEFQKSEKAAPHRAASFSSLSKPAPSKWDDAQKWIASPISNRSKTGQSQAQTAGSRKTGFLGYGSRQTSMKVVTEVPEQRSFAMDEAVTKRIDPSQQVSLSRHDSSISVHSATTFVPPPSTVRSVSMRDMGTEMTPIASQEPSRNGTPVRVTSPTRSPTSSRPASPGRAQPVSSPFQTEDFQVDNNHAELSEKELQKKTRREIMALGAQLGKLNITAWASKEEEDKDASTSFKTVGVNQIPKTVVETRATAWEEAEKAKYMARYKREEIKIEAWENHQKAKTEAEMRKVEVEVERMKTQAHDKLMNKLAATRHKAEEKRAVAEAKRNRQAAKTEQQADYIRRTGRILSTFSFCSWCSCCT